MTRFVFIFSLQLLAYHDAIEFSVISPSYRLELFAFIGKGNIDTPGHSSMDRVAKGGKIMSGSWLCNPTQGAF